MPDSIRVIESNTKLTHHIHHCLARQRRRIRNWTAERRGSAEHHTGHTGRSHLGCYHLGPGTSIVSK